MAHPATKAEPSLEDLIAWLETQPANKTYDWTDPCNCLIGQWLKETGVRPREVRGMSNRIAFTDPFYDIVLGNLNHEHTIGVALDRARAAFGPPDIGAGR